MGTLTLSTHRMRLHGRRCLKSFKQSADAAVTQFNSFIIRFFPPVDVRREWRLELRWRTSRFVVANPQVKSSLKSSQVKSSDLT